jgi:hypothetical protein
MGREARSSYWVHDGVITNLTVGVEGRLKRVRTSFIEEQIKNVQMRGASVPQERSLQKY